VLRLSLLRVSHNASFHLEAEAKAKLSWIASWRYPPCGLVDPSRRRKSCVSVTVKAHTGAIGGCYRVVTGHPKYYTQRRLALSSWRGAQRGSCGPRKPPPRAGGANKALECTGRHAGPVVASALPFAASPALPLFHTWYLPHTSSDTAYCTRVHVSLGPLPLCAAAMPPVARQVLYTASALYEKRQGTMAITSVGLTWTPMG
jgi:hypothetical protein